MHSDQDEDDLAERIDWSDPMSGLMKDMWVNYSSMNGRDMDFAMLFRPRLRREDLEDMVARPEMIQLCAPNGLEAALNGARRYRTYQNSLQRARSMRFFKLGDRRVPPPPLR